MVGRIVALSLIFCGIHKVKLRIHAIEIHNIFITAIAWFSKANDIKCEPFKWLSGWKFVFLFLRDLLSVLCN